MRPEVPFPPSTLNLNMGPTRKTRGLSSPPLAAGGMHCRPVFPDSVVEQGYLCAHSEAEVEESRNLLLELEEATGFLEQRLGGVCFPRN